MQRFCLTLQMRPDERLMEEYVARHQHVWPEVIAAQRAAGVTGMEIFRLGRQLFMLMETTDDFTFERKAALDRANPKVMEWEREMAMYQAADPNADASGKWAPMQKIFDLAAQSQ